MLAAVAAVWLTLHTAPPPLSLPPEIAVRQGDWIFRGGISADSRLIRYLSNSDYSHIGIIVETRPEILIAHAATDDDPQKPDQVLLTPLREFLASDKARSFAVTRPKFLNGRQRRQSALHAKGAIGRPFILAERGKAHYYCTILLLNAVRSQTPSFNPKWQHLNIALFEGDYLFPESFAHEDIEWLYRSHAEK
ncbi:MAG: YiiX/YebB-like N1pC/P60 family cysteine hydrolase [Neisseria sp.]|nr:YiiX/YebB-like N1pC/P60 family cysteine hydrolase [Neisseria sp.]